MHLQIGKTGDRYELEVQNVRALGNGTLQISGVRKAGRGAEVKIELEPATLLKAAQAYIRNPLAAHHLLAAVHPLSNMR